MSHHHSHPPVAPHRPLPPQPGTFDSHFGASDESGSGGGSGSAGGGGSSSSGSGHGGGSGGGRGGVRYGVLRGKVTKFGTEDGTSHPHFQIIVNDGHQDWRIAVNVRSDDGSNDEAAVVNPLVGKPILAQLAGLAVGFTSLPNHVPGLALDFVRESLFAPGDLETLPALGAPDGKDIEDMLVAFTQRAIDEAAAGSELYVWGSRFDVNGKPVAADLKFGNQVGMHDVHMNQGNPPPHQNDNGKYQDGGLIYHFAPANLHVGFFMKFQTQVGTDDSGRVVIPAGTAL